MATDLLAKHRLIRYDRNRYRALLAVLVLALVLVLAGACGDAPATEGGSASPSTSGAGGGSNGGQQVTVDMDAIFPPGEGRDLLLNNCQNCHTWVPVVVLQMNEEEWARWARDHRPRVEGMSDEEFETLYDYLVSNFNPSTPVPELPPALLNTWTSY